MSSLSPPPTTPTPGPPQPPPTSGKATASLVLGICSLFLWFCPLVGLAASITGLVLGLQASKERSTGVATAGIVLCIIGLLASFINMAVGAYLGATGQHPLVNRLQGGG